MHYAFFSTAQTLKCTKWLFAGSNRGSSGWVSA